MNYVIRIDDMYFLGFSMTGDVRFSENKNLAYRMRYPVALTTVEKLRNIEECKFATEIQVEEIKL